MHLKKSKKKKNLEKSLIEKSKESPASIFPIIIFVLKDAKCWFTPDRLLKAQDSQKSYRYP